MKNKKNWAVFIFSFVMIFSLLLCSCKKVNETGLMTSEDISDVVTATSGIVTSAQVTGVVSYTDEQLESMARYTCDVSEGADVVAATVNGTPIYLQSVIMEERNNEVTVKNGLAELEAVSLPESEKEKVRQQYIIKTRDEILKELIRDEVQLLEAKKRGIEVSFDEAYSYNESNYSLAKTGDYQENMRLTSAYMKVKGLSEQEYLNKSAEQIQKVMIRGKLCEKVSEDFTEEQKNDLAAAFADYTDKLSGYDIQIFI